MSKWPGGQICFNQSNDTGAEPDCDGGKWQWVFFIRITISRSLITPLVVVREELGKKPAPVQIKPGAKQCKNKQGLFIARLIAVIRRPCCHTEDLLCIALSKVQKEVHQRE